MLSGSVLPSAQEIVTPTNLVLERLAVGGVLHKNIRLEQFALAADDKSRTQDYLHPTPTTYLRAVLSDVRLREGQSITISSALAVAPVDSIAGPIGEHAGLTYYSAIIPGGRFRITVAGDSLEGASVTLQDIAFQNTPGAVKSIFGNDDRQSYTDLASDLIIANVGKAVAFLSILGNGNVPRTCTGFLINTHQLLTNHHCYLKLPDECDKTAIMFGYEQVIPSGNQFRCKEVTPEHGIENGAFVLDYAIVDIDGNVPESIIPIPLHTFATMAIPEPEQPQDPLEPVERIGAVLVQHPAGEKKQVTRTNCSVFRERVEGANGADDFRHRCDTLKGSSGSPIIIIEHDQSGSIKYCAAGLHHAAFAESGPFSTYNRAVHMPLIAEKLAEKSIKFTKCEISVFSTMN